MCDVSFIGPAVGLASSLFGDDGSGGGDGGRQMVDAASAAQGRLLDTQNRLLTTQVGEFESPEAVALRKAQIGESSANITRKGTDYDTLAVNRKAASDIATQFADPAYMQGQVDAVSADTAAASDASDANQRAQMRSLGVDPSSPAAIAAGAGQGTMRTLGMVNTRNAARRGAMKEALGTNAQVGGMQRGLSSDASSANTAPSTTGVQSSISGMSNLANTAATLDQQAYQRNVAGSAAMGNMIQGGVRAYQNMGNGYTQDAGRPTFEYPSDGNIFAKGGEVGRRPRMLKYAGGGEISGPGGPTDDAVPATIDGNEPAALSDGEYVIKADTTQNVYGPRTLDSVNRGTAMVIDEDELAGIGRNMVTSLLASTRSKPRTLSRAQS